MNQSQRRKPRHTQRQLKRRMCILLVLAAALSLFALAAPVLTPNDPNKPSALAMNQGPSRQYPLGTDRYGRCVLSRVMIGARTSIFAASALTLICFAAGTLLGLVCGYYGGWLDTLIMRIADILLAFPQMVIAIAVAGILGGSLLNAMLALGISEWTQYARLARSHALSLKNEPFVISAKLNGATDLSILFRHMLPNMIGSLTVNAATQLGSDMVNIAGMSFLGLGVTPPQAEWGSMINEARAYIQLAPWAVMGPAAAIILTVMLFYLLGDSVRDYADVSGVRR